MKKLLVSAAALTLILFCVTACSDKGKTHTHVPTHHDAVAATCVTEGSVAYDECGECHKKFDENGNELTEVTIPIDTTAHDLSDIAANPATCAETGNVAYRHCSLCEKNFEEDGVTEIVDVITAEDAANHAYLGDLIGAVGHTCTEDGTVAHYHCAGCDKDVAEDGKTVLESTVNHADPARHSLTRIPAEESTCTVRGNTEHDYCSQCKKNFDENGKELISVETPLKNHTLGEWISEKDEHYRVCSGCNGKFQSSGHDYGANAEADDIKSDHYYTCSVCDYKKREEHKIDADGVCQACSAERAVWNKSYSGVIVNTDGKISVAKNLVFAFGVNGNSRGAAGCVFEKTDGIESVYDGNGNLTGRNLISDTAIGVRYENKSLGKVKIVYSYYLAEEKTLNGNEWGEPSLVTKEIFGYIDGANGVIFLPSGGDDSILLVPSDVPVAADKFSTFNFDYSGDNSLYIEYNSKDDKVGVYCKNTANDEIIATYIGVTVTDFDDNAVAVADFATAKAIIVTGKDGKALAKYGYDEEKKKVVGLDLYAGKYSGDYGLLFVDGFGNAVVDNQKGKYCIAGFENYNLGIYIYGDDKTVINYYEILADSSAYTYTGNRPEITVTFNLGNFGDDFTADVVKNVAYTLPGVTPTDSRYLFNGWKYKTTDGNLTYRAGESASFTDDVELVADWKMKPVVTVDLGGDNVVKIYAIEGENLSDILANVEIPVGEKLKYWSVDGKAVGEGMTVTSDTTIIAVYKAKYALKVVYGNGLEDKEYTLFEDETTNIVVPADTNGKRFGHWYTSEDGGATESAEFEVGGVLTKDTTVYCRWKDLFAYAGSYKGLRLKAENGNAFVAELSFGMTADDEGNIVGLGNGKATKYNGAYLCDGRRCDFDNDAAYENYDISAGLSGDVIIYFRVKGDAVPASAKASAWGDGLYKLSKCTYDDGSETCAFYCNGEIYGNVSFVAYDDKAEEITSVSDVYNASFAYILDDNGEWIAGFKKTDGSLVYDESINRDTEKPSLVTVTVSDGENTLFKFDMLKGCELTVDKLVSEAAKIDGLNVGGWYSDAKYCAAFEKIVLSGNVTVYALLKADNPFGGLTFAGTYLRRSDESNRNISFVFDSGSEIAGTVIADGLRLSFVADFDEEGNLNMQITQTGEFYNCVLKVSVTGNTLVVLTWNSGNRDYSFACASLTRQA